MKPARLVSTLIGIGILLVSAAAAAADDAPARQAKPLICSGYLSMATPTIPAPGWQANLHGEQTVT